MSRHLLLVPWTPQRRIQFWIIVVVIENSALLSAPPFLFLSRFFDTPPLETYAETGPSDDF